MKTCDSCKHFNRVHNQCAAKSPTPVVLMNAKGDPQVLGIWPPTKADNWCGEHLAMTAEQMDHMLREAADRASVITMVKGNGAHNAE